MLLSVLLKVLMASVWLGKESPYGNVPGLGSRTGEIGSVVCVLWEGGIVACKREVLCATSLILKPLIAFPLGSSHWLKTILFFFKCK